MMPLEGPEKGRLQQFLSVPVGAECCGPWITNDERTVLVAVQHPGEVSGASPENPVSRFPSPGDGQPRPGVVQAFSRQKSPGNVERHDTGVRGGGAFWCRPEGGRGVKEGVS